jgi:N-acetylneuraminic acid mutarotase
MIEFRSNHTATLLRDGMVLVAGGAVDQPGPGDVASAELYDSGLGTWTATGDMVTPRYLHTATLLPDGTVLVVGGLPITTLAGSILASAELYDPQSRTWTTTGEMDMSRFRHTATLLSDGKVLVAGGYGEKDPSGPGASLASAELYDPAAETWATTGDMNEPYYEHTATLLLDGKVLVAGIHIDAFSAELYNPATGTWTTTVAMIGPRYSHTATLLRDGRVLFVGGFGGGSLAELYDPSTGTRTTTVGMIGRRYSHTATLLSNGTVLIAGGSTPDLISVASVEVYDPDKGTWTVTRNLVTARSGHTATLLGDDTVLMAGGQTFPADFDGYAATDAVELYDPASGP